MRKKVYIFAGIIYAILLLCFHLLYPIKYKSIITRCSKKYSLETSLVYALINAESSFDANAISSVGACGLMQLMPNTAQYIIEKYHLDIDVNDIFLPAINIELGCAYLHYLKGKFDDRKWVLAAYNAGETVVRNWIQNGDKIRYSQTKKYVKKIEKNILIYQSRILANE